MHNPPSHSPPQPGRDRLLFIDAMRGFAAVAVLLFHSLNNFRAPDALPGVLHWLRFFTEYGYLGVNVFFALSGWCIAQRVRSAIRRHESPGVFLVERGLRIFPTYWAALFITIGAECASALVRGLPITSVLPTSAIAWWGEMTLTQPYLGTNAIVMVSWSLVFELGFYVIAAGALAVRRQFGLSWPAALLVGGLLCLWPFSPWQPTLGLVLDRWPDFFAGIIAWSAVQAGSRRALLIGAIALIVLGVFEVAVLSNWTGLASIGTALLLLPIRQLMLIPTAVIAPLARIGVFSYSLYLLHVTVMSPFQNLCQRWVDSGTNAFIAVWLASLVFSLIASWLLYRFCELPAEHWRKSLKFNTRLQVAPA